MKFLKPEPTVDGHGSLGPILQKSQVTQQWHFPFGFILEAAVWLQVSLSALISMSCVYWQLHVCSRNIQVRVCSDRCFWVSGTLLIWWVSPKPGAKSGSFSWELFSCFRLQRTSAEVVLRWNAEVLLTSATDQLLPIFRQEFSFMGQLGSGIPMSLSSCNHYQLLVLLLVKKKITVN